MPKSIRAHWFLQALANEVVGRLAPDLHIIPVVQYDDEDIEWDDECDGMGRVRWSCGYLLPSDDPTLRALKPLFDAEIAPIQARYDLGLTS